MQKYLEVQRSQRDTLDPYYRNNEFMIKKIQATYDYDRTNAEKVLEYMRVKRVEFLWGSSVGLFAAWKFGPIQKELEHSHALFRKAWMRVPLQLAAFLVAYNIGTQLPARLFKKWQKKTTVLTTTPTQVSTITSRASVSGKPTPRLIQAKRSGCSTT